MHATQDVKTTQVELAALKPHPLNPRSRLTAASVAGLAGLIKAQGLLQPLLVRPEAGDTYEVLDGNRRVLALETLGLKSAAAIVREVDDAEALAIMLSANEERADVDPFLEAAAIEALIVADGSVKHAAARLGKDVRWVAQRRALLSLSPAWLERRKKEPMSEWPVAAWEIISRLSAEAQEDLAVKASTTYRYVFDRGADVRLEDIEELVRERLRVIGKAPFDPEDAKLLRAAGSCVTCPKTSKSVPGLFDDGEPVELASATCRDAGCWGKKAAAALRAKVAEARERNGLAEAPIVLRDGAKVSGAGRALPQHRWTEAKKDDKGAAAVIVVGAGGGVSLGYAKIRAVARDDHAAAAKPKDETPAEALARLEQAYADLVDGRLVEILCDAVSRSVKDPPAALAIVALALEFGTAETYQRGVPSVARDHKVAMACLAGEAKLEEAARALWASVASEVVDDGLGGWHGPELLAERQAMLATALHLKLADLQAEASKLPVPKELAAARMRKGNEVVHALHTGGKIPPEVLAASKPVHGKPSKKEALAARVRQILATKKGKALRSKKGGRRRAAASSR